jgi:hypothetical protein
VKTDSDVIVSNVSDNVIDPKSAQTSRLSTTAMTMNENYLECFTVTYLDHAAGQFRFKHGVAACLQAAQ